MWIGMVQGNNHSTIQNIIASSVDWFDSVKFDDDTGLWFTDMKTSQRSLIGRVRFFPAPIFS